MLIGISGQAGVGKTTAANIFVDHFNFTKVSFATEIKEVAKRWWGFTDEQLYGPSSMRNAPDERYSAREAGNYWVCKICCVSEFGTTHFEVKTLALIDTGKPYHCDVCTEQVARAGELNYVGLSAKYHAPRYFLQGVGDKVRQIEPGIWLRLGLEAADAVPNKRAVIDDGRYINEIEAMKKHGGFLIRIKRPVSGLKGEAGKHPSEVQQLKVSDNIFDAVIDNDGTLEGFKQKVIDIAKSLDLQGEAQQLSFNF
jgi:hypothetical protein